MAKSAKATSDNYQVNVTFTAYITIRVGATSLEEALERGREIMKDTQYPYFSDMVADVIDVENPKVTGVSEE